MMSSVRDCWIWGDGKTFKCKWPVDSQRYGNKPWARGRTWAVHVSHQPCVPAALRMVPSTTNIHRHAHTPSFKNFADPFSCHKGCDFSEFGLLEKIRLKVATNGQFGPQFYQGWVATIAQGGLPLTRMLFLEHFISAFALVFTIHLLCKRDFVFNVPVYPLTSLAILGACKKWLIPSFFSGQSHSSFNIVPENYEKAEKSKEPTAEPVLRNRKNTLTDSFIFHMTPICLRPSCLLLPCLLSQNINALCLSEVKKDMTWN